MTCTPRLRAVAVGLALTCSLVAATRVPAAPAAEPEAGALAATEDEAILAQAQRAFIARDYASARELATRVIGNWPGDPTLQTAASVLVLSEVELGDFDAAAERATALKTQISAQRADSAAIEYLDGLLKAIQARKADYESAIETYRETAARYPDTVVAASAECRVGATHLLYGRRKEAEAAFRQVIRRYPESEPSLEARLKLAGLLQQHGEHGETERLLAGIVGSAPDTAWAGQAVARMRLAAVDETNRPQVQARLEAIIAAHPDTEAAAQAAYGLGEVLMMSGNVKEGIALRSKVALDYPNTIIAGSVARRTAASLFAETRRMADEGEAATALALARKVATLSREDSPYRKFAEHLIGALQSRVFEE